MSAKTEAEQRVVMWKNLRLLVKENHAPPKPPRNAKALLVLVRPADKEKV